ncbi:MAG: GAF domain-containing protein [Calditrichaeota bacterium]|nr:GAF domain-containing protein [Calditrichota bacterium]
MVIPAQEKEAIFEKILARIEQVLQLPVSVEERLHHVCELLAEQVPYYHWVGFYLVDSQSPRELVLGPFVGEPTEHTRIPFGRGICGQAAERGETFVVQDVSQETNYLSCSVHVRSEIVVPIFKEGKIVGGLDIDSHDLEPFSKEDQIYLEKICDRISQIL